MNPSQIKFYEAVNSEIYVNKTNLMRYVNSVIRTQQKYICVIRPRRFGKLVTANMLTAYYGKKPIYMIGILPIKKYGDLCRPG